MDILNKALGFDNLEKYNSILLSDYSNLIYKIKANRIFALRICNPNLDMKRLIDKNEYSRACL